MSRFYLGMNYNDGGIEVAQVLIPLLEQLTGDRCTSRWPYSEAHKSREFRKTISATDVIDIASADYCLFAPLSKTARGCHFEMGLAIGLDKPAYLFRPYGFDGTGFDELCNQWKRDWKRALSTALRKAQHGGNL